MARRLVAVDDGKGWWVRSGNSDKPDAIASDRLAFDATVGLTRKRLEPVEPKNRIAIWVSPCDFDPIERGAHLSVSIDGEGDRCAGTVDAMWSHTLNELQHIPVFEGRHGAAQNDPTYGVCREVLLEFFVG